MNRKVYIKKNSIIKTLNVVCNKRGAGFINGTITLEMAKIHATFLLSEEEGVVEGVTISLDNIRLRI